MLDIPIKTERLILRPLGLQDFDAMWEMASDEAIVAMKSSWPFPPDEDFTRARLSNENATSGRVSAIVHGADMIGTAAVTGGTLGYSLRRDWWGQGFATEAVAAKLRQSFERTDLSQIEAGVWVDNPASQRVLGKLGFEEIGRSKGISNGRGCEVEGIDYILTRQKWSEMTR